MSHLILGLDPSVGSFPKVYLDNSTINVESWGRDILAICKGKVVGVKFQSAYFENLGLKGLHALSNLIKYSKELGLTTIMDAKRGDIGSTSKAYAEAYLSDSSTLGSNDFTCDYLTVNPLMGEDCLDPFIDVALNNQKGVFILLETSNPGASMILKQSINESKKINDKIADYIALKTAALTLSEGALGPIGCVIGATNIDVGHWRKKLPNSIFLMPGIGAQGGGWESVSACLNSNGEGVWVPISRGITQVSGNIKSKDEYLKKVEENLMRHVNAMASALNRSSI